MVDAGTALCVPGNHDVKLMRKLRGKDVQITHGLAESLADSMHETSRSSGPAVAEFLDDLVSHYVFDDGKLVVAHAGMKEAMQGRGSGKVRDFALYGETTGETDEFGLPVRYNWAAEYRGKATVVYGHTPVPEPEWLNRTINIDTGCVFGGKLTALRYPEKEFVSVPAARTYCEPARPFLPERRRPRADGPAAARRSARYGGCARQADHLDPAAPQRHDPRRERHGRPGGHEPVRRQSEMADLPAAHDVALRDEREPGLLEHPAEAFAYYRHAGRAAGRLRREAHGFAGRRDRLPGRGRAHGSASASSAKGSVSLHPHRPAVLRRRANWKRRFLEPGPRSASTGAGFWERVRDRLGLPGLRADALVGEGPGAAEGAVCRRWGSSAGGSERCRWRSGTGRRPGGGWRGTLAGAIPARRRWPHTVCGGIPAILLAGEFGCRPEAGSVSPAGHREAVHVGKDHTWHMTVLAESAMRLTSSLLDPVKQWMSPTPRARRRDRVVGRTDRQGWRGHGCEAIGFCREGSRDGPTGGKMPGQRIPSDHLRTRIHRAGEFGPAPESGVGAKRSLALREFALGIEALERSCAGNRSAESTNVFSGCWRWRANRLIPDSDSATMDVPSTLPTEAISPAACRL